MTSNKTDHGRMCDLPEQEVLRSTPPHLALRPAGDQGREEPGADVQGPGSQHRAGQASQVDQPEGPGHPSGRQVGDAK